MQCRSSLTTIALVVCLAAAATAQEAKAELAGRARVEAVRIDAIVTDAQGRPVVGLQRGDFVVLEDGKPQPLTEFVAVARGVLS